MRKFFISFLFAMLAISTYAQLKMAQFPEDEKKGNITILSRYDSLTNIQNNIMNHETWETTSKTWTWTNAGDSCL